MEPSVNPIQALFLLRLLADPAGAFLKGLKPDLKPALRNALVQAGLIEIEKRKPAAPRARASNYAVLTEKGWNWVERHLDAPLPTQGTAALQVLGRLLARIKPQIDSGRLTLAGLMAPPEAAAEPAPAPSAAAPVSLRARFLDACREASGGATYGVRIRLADLRSILTEVPRDALDRFMMELEQRHEAAFYPFDDPRERQPRDEAAALLNSSGSPRHIVYLSRTAQPEIGRNP